MGYDKVKDILPSPAEQEIEKKKDTLWDKVSLAKKILVSQGYKEVYTYSFTNKGDVSVLASASDKSFLRANLSDGLKDSITLNKGNVALLGLDTIKIFEVGTVFTKKGEEIHVAYRDNKKEEEMPLEEFITRYASEEQEASLDFVERATSFTPWSLYPSITRDIAVWIPSGTPSETLQRLLQDNAGDLLVRAPRLVDQYEKEGRVSYAYRLVFQSYERTLTDEEINKIMENLYNLCKGEGWEIR